MRIISKYKDYYDFYARNFQLSDQNRIWTRNIDLVDVSFALPTKKMFFISNARSKVGNCEIVGHSLIGTYIIFCGKLVPVIYCDWFSYDTQPRSGDSYFYSFEEVMEFLEKHKLNLSCEKLVDMFFNYGYGKIEEFEAYNGNTPPKKTLLDMHRETGSPVIALPAMYEQFIRDYSFGTEKQNHNMNTRNGSCHDRPTVLVNIPLTDIDFIKFKSPFDTFVAIESFLSNELAPRDTRNDLPIPDKLKVQTHGFDVKKSFRKRKE